MDTNERDEAEFAIWKSVMDNFGKPLPKAVAEFLLKLEFSTSSVDRMHELAAKARAGTLRGKESVEAEAFGRVGSVLSILQSKARVALRKSGSKAVGLR